MYHTYRNISIELHLFQYMFQFNNAFNINPRNQGSADICCGISLIVDIMLYTLQSVKILDLKVCDDGTFV
jgi:hypothetical protein